MTKKVTKTTKSKPAKLKGPIRLILGKEGVASAISREPMHHVRGGNL
jgi:hypothetical protein